MSGGAEERRSRGAGEQGGERQEARWKSER